MPETDRLAATAVGPGMVTTWIPRSRAAATRATPGSLIAGVPASAQVVIVIDVAKVIGSPLVDRAIDQLMMRDADLAARWQKLQDTWRTY